MPLTAAVNLSENPDGYLAGSSASRQALAGLQDQPLSMAWVLATPTYDLTRVKSGVSSVLGTQVPLMGFSTSGILSGKNRHNRAVGVAVLAGRHLTIHADWWPDPGEDPHTLGRLIEISREAAGLNDASLLVIGDGFNGVGDLFCRMPVDKQINVAGGLAGGSLLSGRTFQIGGRNSGSGGMAVAWLPEQIRMSTAVGCGWSPVAQPFRIDRAEGLWVRELSDRRPADLLAELFGYSARKWAYPPLNESVRQYPLGLDLDNDLLIRSPLRVEADGSLRMNAVVPEGTSARLMVSNLSNCLQAAARAAQQALEGLGDAHPVFGLLLVDQAWQSLFEAHPGAEVNAVRKVLGDSLPVLGGYGYGQIARRKSSSDLQLFNQHLELILFATE